MKSKILIAALLCAFSCYVFSQTLQPADPVDKDYYLLKSKKQRKTATIMGISGGVLMTAGLIVGIVDATDATLDAVDDGEGSKFSGGAVLFVAGGIVLLGSIPFSIAAHNNKRRYMRFSLQPQRIPGFLQTTELWKFTPGLTVRIGL
jgi:hypothetical protein